LPRSDLCDLSPTVSARNEEYPNALLRSLSDSPSCQAETQALLQRHLPLKRTKSQMILLLSICSNHAAMCRLIGSPGFGQI
jgi:hypothetical protein